MRNTQGAYNRQSLKSLQAMLVRVDGKKRLPKAAARAIFGSYRAKHPFGENADAR
jgi:hypothetical protein